MAKLDFVKYIGDNVDMTDEKKAKILEDFVRQYNYQEKIADNKGGEIDNPVSKEEFMNSKIKDYITQIVNVIRKKDAERAAEYDELILE